MTRRALAALVIALLLDACTRCAGEELEGAPVPPTELAGPPGPAPFTLPEPLFAAHDPVDRPSGVAVSADGSTVAFSTGGRVTDDDSDPDDDVFVYDTRTRAITRVSVGGSGPSYLEERGVSADGRRILFTSGDPLVEDDRNDRIDVYLADRDDRSVTRVSLGPDGHELDGVSYMAAISGDGRVVAFTTHSDGVVPGDRDGVRDIYVRELASGDVERASVGPGGRGPTSETSGPLGVSSDGTRTAFFTTGLVPHDPPADSFSGELDLFVRGESSARFGVDLHERGMASMSTDGRTVVGTRRDAETTVGIRIDLDSLAETVIPSRSVEAIAASPDGRVVAIVDWSGSEDDLVRSLRILRDGASTSSRVIDLDVATTRQGWRSFGVANDGTVVAQFDVRRYDAPTAEWSYRSCVAILAPTPVALACSAPRENEDP